MAGSAFLNPEHLIDAAGVRFGDHVADMGPGRSAHLLFPLAERVGEEGKVYAVDIEPAVLEMIEGLRRQRGTRHMQTVWGDLETPGGINIPAASLDVAFFINTLWTIRQPAVMAQEVGRLVKDDGRIMVMDWQPSSVHPLTPPGEYLLHPRLVDAFFASADLYPQHEVRLSPHHWARTYERL
jgi:ubiquinone/menaquinone biosynthesis C-methylase UbiE